jgi:hypothetical protein
MFDVRGMMFDVGVKPSLYRLFEIRILVRIRRRAATEKAHWASVFAADTAAATTVELMHRKRLMIERLNA